MAYLIDILNTDNELNIIEKIMQQIDTEEWLYFGCFIQKSQHPQLCGKYEVFKNNEEQTHVGRAMTLLEAKRLCKENKCKNNFLKF